MHYARHNHGAHGAELLECPSGTIGRLSFQAGHNGKAFNALRFRRKMEGDPMPRKRAHPLEPLRRFDYGLIGPQLEGLFSNLDRDLQKRVDQALKAGDAEADRCLVLLNMLLRFAWNSYRAVIYVAGNIPEDPRRKPSYALVIPNINRQLLDILFSLAYMLDDFRVRSLAYQRAGWRELLDEYQNFSIHFSKDPLWKAHLAGLKKQLRDQAVRYKITPDEQQKPSLVPYWKTPYQLLDEKTPCSNFLKYLELWLYRDTSAQTHLGHAGIIKVSHFLIADLVGDAVQPAIQDRAEKMYHFTQFSRTAMAFLAIATEIDTYCHCNNHAQIDYLWVMLGEHAIEAREMYQTRYQNRRR